LRHLLFKVWGYRMPALAFVLQQARSVQQVAH
jgi:hypothetical protein